MPILQRNGVLGLIFNLFRRGQRDADREEAIMERVDKYGPVSR